MTKKLRSRNVDGVTITLGIVVVALVVMFGWMFLRDDLREAEWHNRSENVTTSVVPATISVPTTVAPPQISVPTTLQPPELAPNGPGTGSCIERLPDGSTRDCG